MNFLALYFIVNINTQILGAVEYDLYMIYLDKYNISSNNLMDNFNKGRKFHVKYD